MVAVSFKEVRIMKLREELCDLVEACDMTAGVLSVLPGVLILQASERSGYMAEYGSAVLGKLVALPLIVPLRLTSSALNTVFRLKSKK
ncbi:hypothetical protein KBC54_03360 [Patescibacteria group bacterium]|nr:hypothetical protein [Patescibacteria group bacterium]